MRVDAHVHVFPDRLAQAVRNQLGQNPDAPLVDDPLLAGVAAAVHARGFDAAWALPYAHRPGVAESVNEWSASEVANYPWLIAGATFHPGDEHLARLVERALVELRLRVVKLHCSVGQFSPDDPRLAPLWATAARLRVPILIHAGRRRQGVAEPDEVDELAPVLGAYPDLRLVLAHTGFPATAAALALMRRFPNLYADLTPVWKNLILLDAATLREFPGRFLFGSDAPNSPLVPEASAQQLSALALTPHEMESIMGGAACTLIPLSTAAPAP